MSVIDFPEVIVTSDSSNQRNNCSIYDLKSHAMLEQFQGGNSIPKGLTFIKEDFLLSSLLSKPVLKIWTLSSKKEEKSMTVPGLVSALAVTNCGSYCIVAIKKSIHIWEVETGLLLSVVSCHFQDITCLQFISDGSHFISGGQDAFVFVWNLSQQISIYGDDEQRKPLYTWSHHTAEITDIFVTSLGIYSRVATASLDTTCRIYEFDSGILLLTVRMVEPITSLAIDPSESFLLLGCDSGNICKINIFSYGEEVLNFNELEEKSEVVAHEARVICLSVSQLGNLFISGSRDRTVKLWDIQTLCCLHSIPHEGPITNAFIAKRPPILLNGDVLPSFKVSVFKKLLASKDGDDDSNFMVVKKLAPQKLSLMHADSPDLLFNYAVLHGSREERKCASNLKVSMNELLVINSQLYSHVLHDMYSQMADP